MNEAAVRTARATDVEAMLELAARRRAAYAGRAFGFQRPAARAREVQRPFFTRLLGDERFLALVNTGPTGVDGFLIAQHGRPPPPLAALGPDALCIDDFAVAAPDRWGIAGRALLDEAMREAAATAARVIAVCAPEDRPKRRLISDARLDPAAEWWVGRLEPGGRDASAPADFELLVRDAPPVYDPGGPVALALRVERGDQLGPVERAAAARGAVLAVVPVEVTAAELREALAARGSVVASEWFVGKAAGG